MNTQPILSANDRMKEHLRTLGLAIAQLRRQGGLTQMELSEKADISLSYLARIERNACDVPRMPSLAVLYQIAEALDTDLKGLMMVAEEIEEGEQ